MQVVVVYFAEFLLSYQLLYWLQQHISIYSGKIKYTSHTKLYRYSLNLVQ